MIEDSHLEDMCEGPSWLSRADERVRLWWSVITNAIEEALGRVEPDPDGEYDVNTLAKDARVFLDSRWFEYIAEWCGFDRFYSVRSVRELVASYSGTSSRRAKNSTPKEIQALGGTWTINEIARDVGVSPGTISTRLANGWSGEDLFREPTSNGPGRKR